MTNLAICKTCRALTADTAEDIGEHRRRHIEQAGDIERARRAASDATTALKQLEATVKAYEKALEQQKVPTEPEISMRVVEDDELDDNELDDEVPDPADPAARSDAEAAFADQEPDDEDDTDEDEDDEPAAPAGSLYSPGVY